MDRWTGGAHDTALFSQLEPGWEDGGGWEPLVLDVDLHRHRGDDGRAAMALLWLVLRDLAAGEIPLGYGTRQGMGAIRVEGIEATRGGEELPALDAAMGPLPREWKQEIEAWETAWFKTF